jgi:hypothetical protein
MGNKITKSKNNSIENNDDDINTNNNIDDNVFECPICFNIIINSNDIKKTICNHSFCKKCLNHWLENNSCCPLCRINININDSEKQKQIKTNYFKVYEYNGHIFEGRLYYSFLDEFGNYYYGFIIDEYSSPKLIGVWSHLSTMYQL